MKCFIIFFMASGILYPEVEGFCYPLQVNADRSMEVAERFFELKKYNNALSHYNLAVRDFKEQKSWQGYVRAMSGKAHALIKLKNYENARISLDTALSIGNRYLGKSIEVASAYYVYGILQDIMNKPDQSLAMHREALRIRKELLGTNNLQVAECYNGIGEVYRYTVRDYVEADKNFLMSINILEDIQDVSPRYLYRGYYNLATTNRRKNDFEKGLSYAFKAIQTLESIKPRDTTPFMDCYVLIANIYNNQNAYEQAIGYYRKALALRLARREMTSEMANIYKNLATGYIDMGNIPKALHCIDSALMIITRDAYYDSTDMANIHFIKGKALRETNRDKESIQSYLLSLHIQKHYSRSNALDISNSYIGLCETMGKLKLYDSALFYVQKSIECVIPQHTRLENWANPSYEMLKHTPQLYAQLAHKGSILMKLVKEKNEINTLKLALECFYLSDKLMEIFWDSQDRENSRLNFVDGNYYIYELALNSIFNLYHLTSDELYKAEAFQLMDKSKARILRQKVEEATAHISLKIPDSLLSQERNIKSEITALQNKLGSLKKNADSEYEERILSTKMISREKELEIWRNKIKKQFPQYAMGPKGPSLMTMTDLKSKLSKEVIFVEYFFGAKTIYVFASSAGQQHFIGIENKDISKRIYRFGALLSQGLKSNDLKSDYKEYTQLAFSLYTDLLTPILNAFNLNIENEHHQFLIIPDGALNLLPFQALITRRPKDGNIIDYKNLDYLVRHSTISYSYDAASLFAPNYPRSQDKNLLAFGWSDGSKEVYNANSLPGTYQELKSIASIMPGKFVLGKEASKKTFLAQASGYNILHLAVHGKSNNSDIYNNYLEFQDEKLFAHELYGFRLNANNLTVLSACETGYGKVFNAEGVYSIARGFFYAGSKSLLMTLWPIDDHSTASLIPTFYKNLDKQEFVSTALRNSQLGYLQKADEFSAHPSHWAGLVLWGTYKKLGEGSVFSIWYVIIPVFLITMMVLFFMKRKTNAPVRY